MVIEITQWGKDHWSTFAYLETLAVDKQPINFMKMRCNTSRHPLMDHGHDARKYPTKLAGNEVQDDHDDWDCLHDMRQLNLIEVKGLPHDVLPVPLGSRGPLHLEKTRSKLTIGGYIWPGKVTVELTELGWQLAAQLRQHKGRGGSFATFKPDLQGVTMAIH